MPDLGQKYSVLIVSSPLDLHARAVTWALRSLGADVAYFDTSMATPRRAARFTVTRNKVSHNIGTKVPINTVWDRRRFPKDTNPAVHPSDRRFVRLESTYFERDVLQILEQNQNIRWIDHSGARRRAENKLAQLKIAVMCGLNVPDTIVSADPSNVRSFVEAYGSCIAKPFISHLWIKDDEPAFQAATALIDKTTNLTDAVIGACPTIYQETITKRADIRAVLIGDAVYATRYPVTGDRDEHIDVRVNISRGIAKNVEPTTLPANVLDAFRQMVLEFGITYASADFIEGEDKYLYFVDLNPTGQFLFNEAYVPSCQLLDAMAKHILGIVRKSGDRVLTWREYGATGDFASFNEELASASGNVIQPEPFWSEELDLGAGRNEGRECRL